MELRKYEKGETVEGYSSNLAYQLFKGITRDTGLPYTHEHLAKLALLVGELSMDSFYKDALIAAAWLHDSAEDIDGFDVFDPFDKNFERAEGITYLNDLLLEAGEVGEAICFMVNLMTHRKGVLYQDYINSIFTFPETAKLKDLHILAAVLKMSDIRMNTGPDERKNVNKLTEEYFKLKDADEKTLEAFYSKTKVSDDFRKKGCFDFDVGLFVESLLNGFRQKQRAVSADNISYYLPLAEKRLLIEVGMGNNLFHWGKFRNMLKTIYVDSLRCYPGSLYDAKRMGLNRKAPKLADYTPILREIRREVAKGLYKV